MSGEIEIRRRRVGPCSPLFVVAEIGLNHGGSIDRAFALVDAAAAAGASAIKLQLMLAGDLVSEECPRRLTFTRTRCAFFARFGLDEPSCWRLRGRGRAGSRRDAVFLPPSPSASAWSRLQDCQRDLTYRSIDYARAPASRSSSTRMATVAEIPGLWSASGGRTRPRCCIVSAYPVPQGGRTFSHATLAAAFAASRPLGPQRAGGRGADCRHARRHAV